LPAGCLRPSNDGFDFDALNGAAGPSAFVSGPAVVNAIFAAAGKRLRRLPVRYRATQIDLKKQYRAFIRRQSSEQYRKAPPLTIDYSIASGRAPILEPVTQEFVDALAEAGGPPIHTRSPADARAIFADVQSAPIGKPDAKIQDLMLPVGPRGAVRVRILRPPNGDDALPAVIYLHGGGWMLGDVKTHDRLVREIASGAHAAVVFVEFERAPEFRFPAQVEQAYAVAEYVASNSARLNVDGLRLAVAGDGAGGNLAAAVTLLSKERRGPKFAFQVLFYPVTDASFETNSYTALQNGPWLTKAMMEWFWDAYLPAKNARKSIIATPLSATVDELRGLPDTLVITAENDVLRDEGEAYGRKLAEAGVWVTSTRYIGTIHGFAVLNALADTPAARSAITQAIAALRAALD
jgi:acetyl esterase